MDNIDDFYDNLSRENKAFLLAKLIDEYGITGINRYICNISRDDTYSFYDLAGEDLYNLLSLLLYEFSIKEICIYICNECDIVGWNNDWGNERSTKVKCKNEILTFEQCEGQCLGKHVCEKCINEWSINYYGNLVCTDCVD